MFFVNLWSQPLAKPPNFHELWIFLPPSSHSSFLLFRYTATAMQDPSYLCDLYHSSWQCQILNPLSKTRHQTCIPVDTSQAHYHWAKGNFWGYFLLSFLPSSLPSFLFIATPVAYANSWAKNWIRATVMTCGVALLDPLTKCVLRIKPMTLQWPESLQLDS